MKDNIKAELSSQETVEDIYEITVLLDFYGQLLTERQYEIMDYYYNSDLSLGEIAENLGISRQGVYDSIRKAKNTLAGYEKKLGLAERFTHQEEIVEQALNCLKHMGEKIPEYNKNPDFKIAMELLGKILDTL